VLRRPLSVRFITLSRLKKKGYERLPGMQMGAYSALEPGTPPFRFAHTQSRSLRVWQIHRILPVAEPPADGCMHAHLPHASRHQQSPDRGGLPRDDWGLRVGLTWCGAWTVDAMVDAVIAGGVGLAKGSSGEPAPRARVPLLAGRAVA